MTRYFLGGDIGSSKTHVLIADEGGQAVGFGQSGAGNHEQEVVLPPLREGRRQAGEVLVRMAAADVQDERTAFRDEVRKG